MLEKFVADNDFVLLPIGFGKSLCYILLTRVVASFLQE